MTLAAISGLAKHGSISSQSGTRCSQPTQMMLGVSLVGKEIDNVGNRLLQSWRRTILGITIMHEPTGMVS